MVAKIAKYVVLLFVLSVTLSVVVYFFYPPMSPLSRHPPRKTAFMEYREKQWAKEGKKKRIVHYWVPLSRISPYAVKAVIIAEDDKFWRHEGFDYDAIQKALEKDLKKKSFSAGGSTITQQLAKNLFLYPDKSPLRKIKEAILTWRLERHLSKRRIIELYLNYVEWGDGIFGIEAAARHYFGKSAAELTAMEGARLAAVLPNPLKYNPLKESGFVARRANRIYQIMVNRGIVIPAYEDVITPEKSTVPETPDTAPESVSSPAEEPIPTGD